MNVPPNKKKMITLFNMQMKLFTSLLLLFIFGSCQSSLAQNDVKSIRKAYQDVNNQISECKESLDPCGLYLATFELNKDGEPWRAVGTYNQKLNFWYMELEDEEATLQPLKVIVTTDVSRYKIYEEWLFNEQGDLLFYYSKDETDEKQLEKRYYFNKGELIQTLPKSLKSTTSVDSILNRQAKITNILQRLIHL